MRTNELPMTERAIERFTFLHECNELVAEANDLGHSWLERIYNDAYDVGVAVRGRTRTVRFYLARTDLKPL
jgi:hypothetical protein